MRNNLLHKTKNYTFIFIISLFFLILVSCAKNTNKSKSFFLKKTAYTTTLLYSGIIYPIKTTLVPSPVDGIITEMPFQYGEEIKKGDKIFTLYSKKFLIDYKTALLQYIKSKNEFNNQKTKYKEARYLYDRELISTDEYHNYRSNFYSSQLTFLENKENLIALLQLINNHNKFLFDLNISDIEKITKAIHLKVNVENLVVSAPKSGIFLAALNQDENKKISMGSTVKQTDVLAVIGDMSGIYIPIKVNELAVNQLKVGQQVKIKGVAFKHILSGEIKRLEKQGITNGSLPNFIAEIAVPHLTSEEQADIHSGMTANIEILIKHKSALRVPLNAIIEKDGLFYVKWNDKKTKKIREIEVKTGATTLNSVVILSQLKEGDEIIIPASP